MGRLYKQAMDFTPLDVDFFNDDVKVFDLYMKHSWMGQCFLLNLYNRIYKNCYYLEWNASEERHFLQHSGFPHDQVRPMLNTCIELGFFSKELYEKYNILTSKGIQERYCNASVRREHVVITQEYMVVNPKFYTKLKGLSLVDLEGNLIPFTRAQPAKAKGKAAEPAKKAVSAPPKKPAEKIKTPEAPPAEKPKTPPVAGYSAEDVQKDIQIPYEERTPQFKEMHSKSWYDSYIKFNNLIDTEFPSVRNYQNQVSMKDYRTLHQETKFKFYEIEEAMHKLVSKGYMREDSIVWRRLKDAIGWVREPKNKTNGEVKSVRTNVLHDPSKGIIYGAVPTK